jgi:NADPH:quinone reductase-like Zn-dependent oxidoreductase
LHPTAVLIRINAVALNYRDANIANGGNPWPVTKNGVPGNDAAGEIIVAGNRVSLVSVRDCVAPIKTCKQINQIQIYSNQIKFIQIKSNQIARPLIQIKSNRKVQIYLDI